MDAIVTLLSVLLQEIITYCYIHYNFKKFVSPTNLD